MQWVAEPFPHIYSSLLSVFGSHLAPLVLPVLLLLFLHTSRYLPFWALKPAIQHLRSALFMDDSPFPRLSELGPPGVRGTVLIAVTVVMLPLSAKDICFYLYFLLCGS